MQSPETDQSSITSVDDNHILENIEELEKQRRENTANFKREMTKLNKLVKKIDTEINQLKKIRTNR